MGPRAARGDYARRRWIAMAPAPSRAISTATPIPMTALPVAGIRSGIGLPVSSGFATRLVGIRRSIRVQSWLRIRIRVRIGIRIRFRFRLRLGFRFRLGFGLRLSVRRDRMHLPFGDGGAAGLRLVTERLHDQTQLAGGHRLRPSGFAPPVIGNRPMPRRVALGRVGGVGEYPPRHRHRPAPRRPSIAAAMRGESASRRRSADPSDRR